MSTWPSESTLFNTAITGSDANPLMKAWLQTTKQLLGAVAPQTLAISNGAITPAAANILVDTEGGAAADTLSIINTSSLHDGATIMLRAADSSRTVTVQHSTAQGGLATIDGQNVALDIQWPLYAGLVGGRWVEIPGALRAARTPATPDRPGLVKPQTGASDGLELQEDGTLRVRQASAAQRGSVLASETALAGAVPQAGESGKLDESWVEKPPVTLFNTRIVITTSNPAWTPPVTGWARVTVIGGGGAGGNGTDRTTAGKGGGQGGASSFGNITASGGSGGGGAGSYDSNAPGGGGGGGAGKISTRYVYLNNDTSVKIVIGAGGRPSQTSATSNASTHLGGNGQGPEGGPGGNARQGGCGAPGAGNGGYADASTGYCGNGGAGAITGLDYGGGGGGGSGKSKEFVNGSSHVKASGGRATDGGTSGSNTDTAVTGGNGGPGAVIIECYDPEKESA